MLLQLTVVLARGQRDLAAMLEKGKFMTSGSRSWTRREPFFLAQAVAHSQCSAASCLIQATGCTICHYHTNADHSSDTNDVDAAAKDAKFKVLGVPYATEGTAALRKLSYLARPKARIRADGRTVVSDPLKFNPNFTLDRVLEFFPIVNGVRTLHCGCLYDEVLFDFFMWKMTMLYSPKTKVEEDYGKLPLKPRDRHYLFNAVGDSLGDLDLLFDYDRNGKKLSESTRMIRRARGLLEKATLRIEKESKKKQAEKDMARAREKQKKVKNMYVDIDKLASRANELLSDSSVPSECSDESQYESD